MLAEDFYGRIFNLAGKNKPLLEKKENILQNTDYCKFDGSIKMIIVGNKTQRTILTKFLEDLYQQQKIVYGLHVAKSALLTCLVFDSNNQEVHFVDGDSGGYALAAKGLKEQLKKF